ncbi:MAG: hypothetical protein ABSA32_02225, partial [Candidatus Acidiferrales bacterium]
QHPDDLLVTKAAPLHGASPLVVLYPEKLTFGWTKFRGAGHLAVLYLSGALNLGNAGEFFSGDHRYEIILKTIGTEHEKGRILWDFIRFKNPQLDSLFNNPSWTSSLVPAIKMETNVCCFDPVTILVYHDSPATMKWIIGDQCIDIDHDPSTLAVHQRGYLLADFVSLTPEDNQGSSSSHNQEQASYNGGDEPRIAWLVRLRYYINFINPFVRWSLAGICFLWGFLCTIRMAYSRRIGGFVGNGLLSCVGYGGFFVFLYDWLFRMCGW